MESKNIKTRNIIKLEEYAKRQKFPSKVMDNLKVICWPKGVSDLSLYGHWIDLK